MKVFFDYQIFYLQKYGGISRYFYELAKALNELSDCQPKILAPLHRNNYLEENTDDFILKFSPFLKSLINNRFYNKDVFVSNKLTQAFCGFNPKAVMHETYYTHRIETKLPKVTTVHDMIYELYQTGTDDEKKIIAEKKKAFHEADCIIAVSEHTRSDLLMFYPELKSKTFVVRHGVSQGNYPEIKAISDIKPFILFVGNRGWYKNFGKLLHVYANDKNLNSTYDLVCFGGGDATAVEQDQINKYQIVDKVKFRSGSDNMLIALYKTAACLAYISDYEGFGMPVLEAMALSCPVICSNTSSLPEVYGSAAHAIDSKDEHELSKALNTVLFNVDEQQRLVKLGVERAKHFTWHECARKTNELYKKL